MYTLKKSLGQHFLIDEQVSLNIIEALNTHPFERLLEVGPGGGALTKYLLKIQGKELKFVEIDREKITWLTKTYPAIEGKIIEGSVLDIPIPFEKDFTVVGNFPYNISSQILFRMIDWKEHVPYMLGMFQKEVAERTAAKEGSKVYGVVSVLVQAFYQVEYLFEVSENCFNPPPKVKSAVIRLSRLSSPPAIKSERHLFMLVKAAFNQRRKTLRNATKALFEPMELTDPIFDKRAEQLSVQQFAELTFRMR